MVNGVGCPEYGDYWTMLNYTSEKDLLQLPFDQYQRYKIVQDTVGMLRSAMHTAKSLNILDVGGSPATLKSFLPNDHVLICDIADQGGLDLFASGLSLPFADHSFDLTVSVDTLEHIPAQNRSRLLEELIRVSRTGILLAAPFDDPLVVKAEETFQQLLWAHFNEGYDFLEEHRRYGLPDLDHITHILHGSNFITTIVPNGYLHRWLLTISAFFLLQWRYQDNQLSKVINAYFNSSFYHTDNRNPSYRKLIVALRSSAAENFIQQPSELLEDLSQGLCQPGTHSIAEEAAHLHILSIMTTLLTESWSRHALDLEKASQQAFNENAYLTKQIVSLTEQIESLTEQIKSLTEQNGFFSNELAKKIQIEQNVSHLESENQQLFRRNNFLSAELAEIHNSTAWKLVRILWRIRLRLIPYESRREKLLLTLLQAIRSFRGRAKKNSLEVISTQPFVSATIASQDDIPSSLFEPSSDYDIIIFPIIDWDFRFQRPQHLAKNLASSGRRVFYLRTTFSDQLHIKLTAMPNVIEVTLPGNKNLNLYKDLLDPVTEEQAAKAISELQERFSIDQAILFVNLPFWYPLASRIKEKHSWKLVYDCLDYHVGFGNISEQIIEMEEHLSVESNLVLATSHKLFNLQSQKNSNCVLLPNAADFDHFHTTSSQIPHRLRDLQHPIIGYYGAISTWFDSTLVAELAYQRPDWSFVLIGSTWGSDLKALKGLKNIHLIDEVPYADLPAYLHAFDTCFIPFQKNDLTDATNPVKMFEFLSAGKPVVASDLEELQNYRQFVLLADSKTWLPLLEQSLSENAPEIVAARKNFARQNTWEQRAAELDQQIRQLFPLASILVLTYNQLNYTQLCLQSIFEHTHYPNYEVIVVDNASTDETPIYLKTLTTIHPNLKIILNHTNAGFARANNQAAAISYGEYVVFLNNDTVVTPGWLNRLLRHLHNPDIGLVGPVTNEIANESKIPVPYTVLADLNSFANQLARQKSGQSFELRVAALFCATMRKQVFLDIGGLDERYGIGMFEDDDLAESLRQRNLKIICAEDTFVHHWGRGGFKQMPFDAYLKIFEENRLKFEEKWGKNWTQHSQG
jgi:GT2 family glycosyltransferase/glycosyltransferase involved in cell wall biosynthesis